MIYLFCTILALVEPFHDYYVINGADSKKVRENSLWHKIDLLQWVLIYAVLAYVAQNPFVFIFGGLVRQFCMQVVLNTLRSKPTFYLSSKGVDGFLSKWVGGFWVAVLSLLGAISVVVFTL
jgi:hypothetical protein